MLQESKLHFCIIETIIKAKKREGLGGLSMKILRTPNPLLFYIITILLDFKLSITVRNNKIYTEACFLSVFRVCIFFFL